jgi:hypothetical protein
MRPARKVNGNGLWKLPKNLRKVECAKAYSGLKTEKAEGFRGVAFYKDFAPDGAAVRGCSLQRSVGW